MTRTLRSPLTLLTAVCLSFELLITSIRAQSVAVVNNCSSSVYVSSSQPLYYKGGALASGSNVNISTSGLNAVSSGFQLSFSTGCSSDGTGCATGPNGTAPLYSAVFFESSAANSITYNINVFEGFNVGVEVEATGSSHCPAFACDGLGSGCPVPGPSGTCYSPCCSSAFACKGGAPTECSAPGIYDSFFASNCPNAQTHLTYNATALPGTQATCVTDGLVVTLCPGFSSKISLAEIASGSFPTSVASPIPSSTSSSSSSSTSTSSSSSSQTNSPSTQSSSPPIGAIVGGVVGGIVALALVVIAFLLWRRSHHTSGTGATFTEMSERRVDAYDAPSSTTVAAAIGLSPSAPSASDVAERTTTVAHQNTNTNTPYPYHTAASLAQYPPSKRDAPPSTGTTRSPTSASTSGGEQMRLLPAPVSSASSSSRPHPPAEDAATRGEGSSSGVNPLAEEHEQAHYDEAPPPSYEEAEDGGGF